MHRAEKTSIFGPISTNTYLMDKQALYDTLPERLSRSTPAIITQFHLPKNEELFIKNKMTIEFFEKVGFSVTLNNLIEPYSLSELPLHNNQSELAVRRKVRKRDNSLHTMSEQGAAAQDAFKYVVETAARLGINALDYLFDRLSQKYYSMTSLTELFVIKTD